MALNDSEYKSMAQAAMQALIGCDNSILVSPEEIAEKAWRFANAMAEKAKELERASNGTDKLTPVFAGYVAPAQTILNPHAISSDTRVIGLSKSGL